jgi:hypothetical protein
MRRAVLVAFAALACAEGPRPEPLDSTESNYQLGVEVRANVGSPFIIVQRTQSWPALSANRVWYYAHVIDRHELTYSGREGTVLLVAYREFHEEPGSGAPMLARPAFAQDLRYDLALSDIIAFRDYRIRVIEATTEGIRAVVLSDRKPVPTEQ